MKQFRLLRNNKETGPFTAAQLIASGLKPYDLLWEEGKSAAWRYPSEIAEFKSVAPVVEEQPFDRFYKRKTVTASNAQAVTTVAQPATDATPQAKPRIRIKADTRKIEPQAVTAPQKMETIYVPAQPPVQQKQETPATTAGRTPEWESMWLDWEQEKTAVTKAASMPEPETSPTIKYTQSLDEIKEKYVATVLNRKTATNFLIQYKHYLAVFIIAITVLGSGIWLGLRWGNEHKTVNPVKGDTNIVEQPQQETPANPTVLVEDDVVSGSIEEVTDQKGPAVVTIPVVNKKTTPDKQNSLQANTQRQTQPQAKKGNQVTINKKPLTNNTIPQTEVALPLTKPAGTISNTAAIKENPEQDDIMSRITRSAPSIGDYVVIRNKSQGYGATGVQYKVENISSNTLELVMIDLQYLDAAGRFQKGQTVYVRNIGPGETTLIQAPDDAAASKITCKISMITSEKDNLYLIAE